MEKRLLSFILAVLILFGSLPGGTFAFADETDDGSIVIANAVQDEEPADAEDQDIQDEENETPQNDGDKEDEVEENDGLTGEDAEEETLSVTVEPVTEETAMTLEEVGETEYAEALKEVIESGYEPVLTVNIKLENQADGTLTVHMAQESFKDLPEGCLLYLIKDGEAEPLEFTQDEETYEITFKAETLGILVLLRPETVTQEQVGESVEEKAEDGSVSSVAETALEEPQIIDEEHVTLNVTLNGTLEDTQTVTAPVVRNAPRLLNASGDSTSPITYLTTEIFYGGEWKELDGEEYYDTEAQTVGTIASEGEEYVWEASGPSPSHRFNYRINFGVDASHTDGVFAGDLDPENAQVKFTVPKSMLTDRNGNPADSVNLPILSRDEILALQASGTEIGNESKFTWLDNGDSILIYNWLDLESHYEGFIEVQYLTSENTHFYHDMTASDSFDVSMEATAEWTVQETEEHIIETNTATTSGPKFYIDTHATILTTEMNIPSVSGTWPFNGTAAPTAEEVYDARGDITDVSGNTVPFNSGDFIYLTWNIRSRIDETSQPYTLTIDDDIIMSGLECVDEAGNTYAFGDANFPIPEDSVFPIAVKFVDSNGYQLLSADGTATSEETTYSGVRDDQVVVAMRKEFWKQMLHWKVVNHADMTVNGVDGIDDPSEVSCERLFPWNKTPWYVGGEGTMDSFLWADGRYRYALSSGAGSGERLTDIGMHASAYSRYDLDELLDGSVDSLGGLDYAQGTNMRILPYTLDPEYETKIAAAEAQLGELETEPDDPSTDPRCIQYYYGKSPFHVEMGVDEFWLFDEANGYQPDQNAENPSILLESGDFQIDSIAWSTPLTDKAYNAFDADFTTDIAPQYWNADNNATLVPDLNTPLTEEHKETVRLYLKRLNETTGQEEWFPAGDYDMANRQWYNVDDNLIEGFDGYNIELQDGVVGYKFETYHTHYSYSLNAVPNIRIFNDETGAEPSKLRQLVNDALADGRDFVESIGIDATGTVVAERKTLDDGGQPVWTTVYDEERRDSDYIRIIERSSTLEKNVIASSNNIRGNFCTVTWQVYQAETMTSSEGETAMVDQRSGIFYDLLPDGATVDLESIQVTNENGVIPASSITVEQFQNYNGTGRILLKVSVSDPAENYMFTYDTIHSYDAVRDYGNDIYNPIAYESGNKTIKFGQTNSETPKALAGTTGQNGQGTAYMSNDHSTTMQNLPSDAEDDETSFLYAEQVYNISLIVASAMGATKRVRTSGSKTYTTLAMTAAEEDYSYRLRFQGSYVNEVTDIVFFDNLEVYDVDTEDGFVHDWQGKVKSLDLSNLTSKGIAPAVWVSTQVITPDDMSDMTVLGYTQLSGWMEDDFSAWQEENGRIRSIAIDCGTDTDGEQYFLPKGNALSAYIYMTAPLEPDTMPAVGYPATFNGMYIRAAQKPDDGDVLPATIAEIVYTEVRFVLQNNIYIKKIDTEGNGIGAITFRLRGTSDYGTPVDISQTSSRSGFITFSDIEKGRYLLTEDDSNADWIHLTTAYTVIIDGIGRVWISDTGFDTEANGSVKWYPVTESDGITRQRPGIGGTAVTEDVNFTNENLEVVNEPRLHRNVIFMKSRSGEQISALQGAVFELRGESDYGTAVSTLATSNSAGIVTIADVEPGTYTLTEIVAPSGFVLDTTVYRVVVEGTTNENLTQSIQAPVLDDNGDPVLDQYGNQTYEDVERDGVYSVIRNNQEFWDVGLRKVDADNTGLWLQGATVRLTGSALHDYSYTADGQETVTSSVDTNGNYYIETVSDANGFISFPGIRAGTYIMKETMAPTNVDANGHTGTGGTLSYSPDSTEHVLTVNADGTYTIDGLSQNGYGEYILTNARSLTGQITIYKRWIDTGDNDDRPVPTVTLTADPESVAEVGITVTKEWVGDNASMRPGDVAVEVYSKPTTVGDGYQVIQYIEANAAGSLIDTGLSLSDDGYEIHTKFGAGTNANCEDGAVSSVYSNTSGSALNAYSINCYGDGLMMSAYENAGTWLEVSGGTDGKTYAVVQDATGTFINNVFHAYNAEARATSASSDTLKLFGTDGFDGKLYYFQMSHDGTPVLDMVPVVNASGVYGMYDLINGTFYPSTTNAFTGPAVVSSTPVLVATNDARDTEHYMASIEGGSNGGWNVSGNTWTYTFPVTVDGTKEFSVCEAGVPAGYTSTADGVDNAVTVQSRNATVVNVLDPDPVDFDYTGAVQTFTAPYTGLYKLETWGAAGGAYDNAYARNANGSYSAQWSSIPQPGGYSSMVVSLQQGQTLYVAVGGKGEDLVGLTTNFGTAGGWNGGGAGSAPDTSAYSLRYRSGCGGGGATHIALADGVLASLADQRDQVLLVAGAGGGASWYLTPGNTSASNFSYTIGYGGGESGGDVVCIYIYSGRRYTYRADGGTQTDGYAFGQGEDAGPASANSCGKEGHGGGGGGWYGGHALGYVNAKGTSLHGAGGSGHVSTDYSGYVMNAVLLSGNESFLAPDGTSETGHDGNGYARITPVDENGEPYEVDTSGIGSSSGQTGGTTESTSVPVSTYVTEDSGWENLGDGLWRYVFPVFNDNATYTARELASSVPGYTCDQDVITFDGHNQKSVEFKNRMDNLYGDLTISKTVLDYDGTPMDSSQIFNFTVTLQGHESAGVETFGGVVFTNGVATVAIAGNESLTISGLTTGTSYTVSEEANPSFNDGAQLADETGTITGGSTVTASFTNVHNEPPAPEDVTLAKAITNANDPSDTDISFSFYAELSGLEPSMQYIVEDGTGGERMRFTSSSAGTAGITLALKAGENAVFKELPAGSSYRFIEYAGDWVSSYSLTDANSAGTFVRDSAYNSAKQLSLSTAAETLDPNEEVTVTFTNDLSATQSLTVEKVLAGPVTEALSEAYFEFSIVLSNLPAGYAVQSTAGRWVADNYGEVTKTVRLQGGDSVSFSNLPVGAQYRVTEAQNDCAASYAFTVEDGQTGVFVQSGAENESNQTVLSTQTETVNRNEDATLTFTNTNIEREVAVTKLAEGNMRSLNRQFRFTFTASSLAGGTVTLNGEEVTLSDAGTLTFTLRHGETAVIGSLPYGTGYSITEAISEYSASYAVDGGESVSGRTMNGTIGTENTSVTYTNVLSLAIPTGIRIGYPTVYAVFTGVVGIAFILWLKRKRDEEEH